MRQRKSAEERRDEIVAVTLDLALENGPEAITTEAIAGRVGVTQAAIFRHFPRKQDIWAAVVAWLGERMTLRWSEAQAGLEDPEARLRAVVRSQWRFIQTVPALPAVLMSRALHGEAALRQALLMLMGRFRAVLAGIVSDGQAAGVFRPEIAPTQAADLIIALVQGTALRWLMTQRGFDLAAEGEVLADTLLHGLRRSG